jgi:hypothetical protein
MPRPPQHIKKGSRKAGKNMSNKEKKTCWRIRRTVLNSAKRSYYKERKIDWYSQRNEHYQSQERKKEIAVKMYL